MRLRAGGLASILAVMVAATGCGNGAYSVVVRFEPVTLAPMAERVEVSLVGSCAAQSSAGAAPISARQTVEARRGGAAMTLAEAAPGRYGLYARAFASDCRVIAAGCTDVTLEADGEGELVVTARAVAGPACPAGTMCIASACIGPDAGFDAARPDGARPDAGPNLDGGTRPDAGSDAGSDAGPACTCAPCASCDAVGSCQPDHALCGSGMYCDPVGGCMAGTACGAGDTCTEDTNPCTTVVCMAGLCVPDPSPDGTACAGTTRGQCWAGTCCAGCWTGGSCATGTDATACGGGGARCNGCVDGNPCTSDSCIGGTCSNPSDDTASCPGGSCHTGACCTGCWDGASCQTGDTDLACGGAGEACNACSTTMCPLTRCASAVCSARGVTSVETRGGFTCGIATDQTLWCWGEGTSGELGTGGMVSRPTPTRLGSDADWAQVSVGHRFACAVKTDGTLWCWGANEDGQHGTSDTTRHLTPVRAGGARTDWASVITGVAHTCALTSAGALYCWGDNSDGQLGLGGGTDRLTPVRVGTATWLRVAGRTNHTCGVQTDGTLWCWGTNDRGELGLGAGSIGGVHDSPERVGTETNWREVSGGGSSTLFGTGFTCGVRATGALYCWGSNIAGQLGLGAADSSNHPIVTRVGTATDWVRVSVGSFNACATTTGGTLWCWGEGGQGQIGDGFRTQRAAPTRVGTVTTWSAASAGHETACAVRMDRTGWCWGDNAMGNLGDGTTTPHIVPGLVCL